MAGPPKYEGGGGTRIHSRWVEHSTQGKYTPQWGEHNTLFGGNFGQRAIGKKMFSESPPEEGPTGTITLMRQSVTLIK